MAKNFKGIKNKPSSKQPGESRKPEEKDEGALQNVLLTATNRAQAKADLERRIAEKLAQMSETDLEELFVMHEQQRKANQSREKAETSRFSESLEGQIAFETVNAEESIIQEIDFEPDPEPELVFELEPEPEPELVFELESEPEPEPEPSSQVKFEFEEALASELETDLMINSDVDSTTDSDLEKRVEEFYKNYDVFDDKVQFDQDEDKQRIPFLETVSAYGQKTKAYMGKLRNHAQGGAQGVRKTVASCTDKICIAIAERKRQANKQPTPRQRTAKYIFLRFKRRFVRNEKKASSSMAEFIKRMDQRNDLLAEKTTQIVVRHNRRFNFIREWSDLHKRGLLVSLLVMVMLAIGTTGLVNALSAYEYAYNGRVLGMVKNQEDVLKILSVVSKELTQEYGTAIEINKDQDITFNRIWAVGKDIDDMQDVLNRLTYMQNMNAKAYAIYIDGRRIGVLDTETRAQLILQSVKDLYMAQDANTTVAFEQVAFAEEVEVRQIDTQLGRIQNPEDVEKRILTGAVEEKVHVVKKGETFSEIARNYNMTQSELLEANPGITPAKLNIDQQIVLTQAVPLVTVQTVEVVTYIEPIPYETVYEDSASIFKGETSTKVKGVNGEREVTARITKNNGIEVAKTELSSTILSEASAAVVLTGTKDLPPSQGSGTFIYPVKGARLSSKYGMRSGRMHNGIDLACSTGTRISASDGGTVTFAGYSGSYGYVVKIDHGRNFETVYAHCSKLFVKKGEKVYQGQHIANVGNTGRSTGPHCHFEVKVNGVAKNPLNYLP